MKVQFISAIAITFCLGVSTQVVASEPSCEELKTQAEKTLKQKGDDGSVVAVVRVKDSTEGELIGYCAEGQRKVVILKRDPT